MTPDLDALSGSCAEGRLCSCGHAVLAFLFLPFHEKDGLRCQA